MAAAPLIAVCLAFSFLSCARSLVWHDSIGFNRDILRLYPSEVRAHYNMAMAYQSTGALSAAEQEFRATLARNFFSDAAINLAVLMAKQGRLDEAVTVLNTAAERTPLHPSIYYDLGFIRQLQSRWDDAIRAYKRALDLRPDMVDAHRNLAEVYGKKKMFREGVEEYRQAMLLDPAFADQVAEALKR